MPPTHVVIRPFPGPGGLQLPGAEVDASEWRNTDALVRRRYLRPIDRPAVRTPTTPAARSVEPEEPRLPIGGEPGEAPEAEALVADAAERPEYSAVEEDLEDAPASRKRPRKATPVSKSAATRRKR